ncbi:MAG: hypothetical protein HFG95_11015 [Dorea sp.]|nr:hypothetical protein [Dorea sp.]
MLEVDMCILLLRIIMYLCTAYVFTKIHIRYSYEISGIAQAGIIFICAILEFSLLKLKYTVFDNQDVIQYKMLVFIIAFGVIILILWGIDKSHERKRIQELTAYMHRTREVIPSVERMLARLEEASDHIDKSNEIIRELRQICSTDMERTKKEVSNIKTFHTTGSAALNEQLEGYLEEAAENDFEMDIMVQAPIDELLKTEHIEVYLLMQIIGDLYRNAFKTVTKGKVNGRILICFGYNAEGYYEISIYDNGEPFASHILKHLGERGNTTGGTGHGIADVFEALHKSRGSFILDQNLPGGNVFTKGIYIVFDRKGEVKVR